MKRKHKQIQCVISNREFISAESANSPSTARRYGKGIVLSQQIGLKALMNPWGISKTSCGNWMMTKQPAIVCLLGKHWTWVIRFPHTEPIKANMKRRRLFHSWENLKRWEVIQKHSDVPSTDSIRSPHEIDNEEDQQKPLKDVKDFLGIEWWFEHWSYYLNLIKFGGFSWIYLCFP